MTSISPWELLHYHIDHLPAAARFFSSLFITAADHDKGLQELGWRHRREICSRAGTGGAGLGLRQFRGAAGQGLPIVRV